jgi:hypothetical protein
MPDPKPRRRAAIVVTAVLVVLALAPLLYLVLRDRAAAPERDVVGATWASPLVRPEGWRGQAPASGPTSAPSSNSLRVVYQGKGYTIIETERSPDSPEARAQAIKLWEQTRADYLSTAKYPDWSRPATESDRHLWEWNKGSGAGQAFALDGQDRPISGILTLDRMFAGPGEAITATMEVWSGEYTSTERAPVPFTARGVVHGMGLEEAATFEFVPVPDAPTKQQARFVPSTFAKLDKRASTHMLRAFVTAGDRTHTFMQQFRYAETAPFVVDGKESEGVVNGSLQVKLQGRVLTEATGHMWVTATLYDAAGKTPIAVYNKPVEIRGAGPVLLTLTFFGKALRERGIDGPYSIRALHGMLTVVDDGGMHDIMWGYDAVITTNRYAAKVFSDAEYDGPDKREKLEYYQREIDRLKRDVP